MAKGSVFERTICSELSWWWSEGKTDSVFWRTGGSGARATVRSRKQKQTANQFGDVGLTDISGAPLLRLLVFSLKRGYSRSTSHDILDRLRHQRQPEWGQWFNEIAATATAARIPYWAVIARRDQREAVVFFPSTLMVILRKVGAFAEYPRPSLVLEAECGGTVFRVTGMQLETFFSGVKPEHLRKVLRGLKT